jgi:hypothetical protein
MPEMFHLHKKLISQQKNCTNLFTSLLVIIKQVHLVLGTIKGHSKMCSFVTQHNAVDVFAVLREQAIGMLTAGMSTRVVAR